MEEKFLEEVYPRPWYNLSSKFDKQPKIKNFPGRLFLNDLNSKIVNGIRIRQVRVKKSKWIFFFTPYPFQINHNFIKVIYAKMNSEMSLHKALQIQ